MNKKLLGISRIIVAGVVLVAVITQLVYGLFVNPTFKIANFFSFFTIESNILGLIVTFTAGVFLLRAKKLQNIDSFRGAATLYMVITGITYFLLLRGFEDQLNTSLAWVNVVLHYAFPILIFLDWIFSPITQKISFKKALSWVIFPIAYLVYSLIRGPIVNWYPYPFLNPANGGYGKVVIVSIGIAALTFGLVWLLTRKPGVKA